MTSPTAKLITELFDTTAKLKLGEPRYVVVRSYHDRSGILATFGPLPTEEEAQAVAAALADVGVGDMLEVYPCYGVTT